MTDGPILVAHACNAIFSPRRIRQARLSHSIDDWFLHIVLEPFFVQYHPERRMGVKENHAGQSGLDLTDEERLTFFYVLEYTHIYIYSIYYFFLLLNVARVRS